MIKIKKSIIYIYFVLLASITLVSCNDAKSVEISSAIIPNERDALLVKVNQNGTVEYLIGYNSNSDDWLNTDNLIPKDRESDSLHDILYNNDKEYVYESIELTNSEKQELNALVDNVIKSDNENPLSYSDGLDIYMRVGDDEYHSMLIKDNSDDFCDRDVAMNNLMYILWGLRPNEMDEYFSNVNRYPKYMFEVNQNNYKTYFK